MTTRPPVQAFAAQTARAEVRAAEDAVWRDRDESVTGRASIIGLLRREWAREREHALREDLWASTGDRIAVRFQIDASQRRIHDARPPEGDDAQPLR